MANVTPPPDPREPPSTAFLISNNAPEDMKQSIARIMAKAQGCDCDCEIVGPIEDGPNLGHFRVAHDDWCQLIRSAQAPDN